MAMDAEEQWPAAKLLIVGGCRSGKSRYGLQAAEALPAVEKLFLATCMPEDDEMRSRIERHRRERGGRWTTLETPLRLPEAVEHNADPGRVLLVDCLTLWVSNLMQRETEEAQIMQRIQRLVQSLKAAAGPVILVSNEVGAGIVPENVLARRFRDLVGLANQQVAAAADRVVWMVAGLPVAVKGALVHDGG